MHCVLFFFSIRKVRLLRAFGFVWQMTIHTLCCKHGNIIPIHMLFFFCIYRSDRYEKLRLNRESDKNKYEYKYRILHTHNNSNIFFVHRCCCINILFICFSRLIKKKKNSINVFSYDIVELIRKYLFALSSG